MRRITRIACAAAVAAALPLLAPGPAIAGGPTSVLLVSPGRSATASMYFSDEAYDRLQRLLGENPEADPAAPDLRGGPGSDAINVTWLIHDVQIWRVDRIFTDAKDGPWVQTLMVPEGGTGALGSTGTTHRAADGPELIALLSALKLLGTSPPAAYQGAKAPLSQNQSQNQPVAAANTAASSPADQPVHALDWLWLVVGLAGGAVLVVGFRPLVRRLRPN